MLADHLGIGSVVDQMATCDRHVLHGPAQCPCMQVTVGKKRRIAANIHDNPGHKQIQAHHGEEKTSPACCPERQELVDGQPHFFFGSAWKNNSFL